MKWGLDSFNPQDAAHIQAIDSDLIELDSATAAPLRAWLTIDHNATSGSIALDSAGCKMLQIKTGNKITVCRLGPGKPEAIEMSKC